MDGMTRHHHAAAEDVAMQTDYDPVRWLAGVSQPRRFDMAWADVHAA
jgi:hypothetical protein